MEPTIISTEDQEITDAFASIPEEVKDFIISNDFTVIITTIQKALSLTDEQTNLLKYGAQELLMKAATMEDLVKRWQQKGISDELIAKMLYTIHQEILVRAANITDFFTEEIDESNIENQQPSAPSPSDILATLKERLQEAKVVTPTSRTQGIQPQVPKSSTASIDPYREMPE
jgi:hypothetical protein